MLPPDRSDRIQIVFGDHRLVANAGLIVPVTLDHHFRVGELVDRHVDLGRAPGRANAGDKMLTLVASALVSGDCIDDDAPPAGGTEQVLGCRIKAPPLQQRSYLLPARDTPQISLPTTSIPANSTQHQRRFHLGLATANANSH